MTCTTASSFTRFTEYALRAVLSHVLTLESVDHDSIFPGIRDCPLIMKRKHSAIAVSLTFPIRKIEEATAVD